MEHLLLQNVHSTDFKNKNMPKVRFLKVFFTDHWHICSEKNNELFTAERETQNSS